MPCSVAMLLPLGTAQDKAGLLRARRFPALARLSRASEHLSSKPSKTCLARAQNSWLACPSTLLCQANWPEWSALARKHHKQAKSTPSASYELSSASVGGSFRKTAQKLKPLWWKKGMRPYFVLGLVDSAEIGAGQAAWGTAGLKMAAFGETDPCRARCATA